MTDDHSERPNRLPWPPMIYATAIVAAVVAGMIVPISLDRFPEMPRRLIAILLIVGSLAADIWAMRTLAGGKTTIMPHKRSANLVTGGPFAHSRNPIYVANTALTIAIGLLSSNGWFLLFAFAAAFATQKLAIEREERHLQALFGEEYRRYRENVRRWL